MKTQKENAYSQYLSEIRRIVSELKLKYLTRDVDEAYANGFWDLAGELSSNEQQQESLYYIFYDIAEACLNKDLSGEPIK